MSSSIVVCLCVHERELERDDSSLLPYPCIAPTTYNNSLGNSSRLKHAIHRYIDYYLLLIMDAVITLCITNETTYSITEGLSP